MLLVGGCLSLFWLGFVVFLDLYYDKAPRVTIGGVKILLAVWLAWLSIYVAWCALRALVARLTVRRNETS